MDSTTTQLWSSRSSFIPPQHIRTLRTFVRQRRTNLQLASDHIRRAHKALELMNIKLQNVITQINGKSGLAVLTAIINGNHNPENLAALCEESILKKKKEAVIKSLKGNFSDENIFLLTQAVDAYLFYLKHVDDCDKQIENHLSLITQELPQPEKLNKPKPIRHHKPNIDNLHIKLMQLTDGKDASQITGLTDSTLLQVISEVGTDLSRFPTEKHFTSWLGLSPNSHQSGLTNKKKKFKRHTSAGQIFRLAAQAIAQSKHLALTSFYHRIKARKGSLGAIKATARKIAVIFYNVMTKGIEFVEQGIKQYEPAYRSLLHKSRRWQNYCMVEGTNLKEQPAMMGKKELAPKLLYSVTIEDLVPVDNFYRQLSEFLDMRFAYQECKRIYGKTGNPSIDPVVFFKLVLFGYFENIISDRELIRRASDSLGVRLYLGY
ncbi:MAG: transposase, partial [Bacteroidetes bacterium]|nr:transposase [Bacteroidota bacterium]